VAEPAASATVAATRAVTASAMMDTSLVLIPPFLLRESDAASVALDREGVGTRPVKLW
jgi:hypothetical protein